MTYWLTIIILTFDISLTGIYLEKLLQKQLNLLVPLKASQDLDQS